MKQKFSGNAFIIGSVIITVLIVGIILLAKQGRKEKAPSNNLSLYQETISETAGKYSDEICKISFKYPKDWTKSNLILPLPQKPLSEATFNEPAKGSLPPKNSILSFICYDAKKYSFDQFVGQNSLSQGQAEVLNAGSVRWQRADNFVYATKGDKLLIFEMFFTKYDLKPEPGYENIFIDIIKSVQFL